MENTKCSNCGAVFNLIEPKCPFCGYINPSGAESKFMRDLENNRNNLNTVVDDIKKSCSDTVIKSLKYIIKIVSVTIIVILALIGGYTLLSKNKDKENYINEIAWEHEHFEEYNEMFINEEYENLMELLTTDSEKHDIWNWEHYDDFMVIAEQLWK